MNNHTISYTREYCLAFTSLLLAITALVTLPGMLKATDINVTTTSVGEIDDGDCSLIGAIKASNTNTAIYGCPGGDDNNDTVVLQANQTYAVTTIDNVQGLDKATGLPVIAGALVIRGNNATIQRASADKFRLITATAPLTSPDLTLRDGDIDWSGAAVFTAAT